MSKPRIATGVPSVEAYATLDRIAEAMKTLARDHRARTLSRTRLTEAAYNKLVAEKMATKPDVGTLPKAPLGEWKGGK